jgi:RimJ/RimL family protein N-acetyltransferase
MWNIAWDVPKFEFGFWVRTSQEHKGYITEATNALTRYCFLQQGVRRIELYCDPKNIRSQLVPKRLGFQLEKKLHSNTSEFSSSERANAIVFSRVDLTNLPELEVTWGDATKTP